MDIHYRLAEALFDVVDVSPVNPHEEHTAGVIALATDDIAQAIIAAEQGSDLYSVLNEAGWVKPL